jgi:hypothetical protein
MLVLAGLFATSGVYWLLLVMSFASLCALGVSCLLSYVLHRVLGLQCLVCNAVHVTNVFMAVVVALTVHYT